jgi:indolepyruvate ferredoxin oxidoreductase
MGMKKKIKLGKWFDGAFRMLYAMRGLRGGALDVFGRAEVRRVERALIGEYRALVEKALAGLSADSYARAVKLAALPDVIRGYEEIKLRNVAKFREQVKALGF